MNTEKIAFLFPYHVIHGSSERIPLLVLDAEELPLITNLYFELYFLGLQPLTEYQVSIKLEKEEGGMIAEMPNGVGAKIMAKPGSNHNATLAASAALHFEKAIFHSEGDYLITATIFRDTQQLHSASAYFSVSLEHEQ